jgi:phosphoribosylanthranilate isomerase
MTWVKICGTTNLEDALVAVDAGADAVGFVFYEKSPRCVSLEAAREIVEKLPESVEKVAVLAGSSMERAFVFGSLGFDSLQVYPFSDTRSPDSRTKATGNGGLRVSLAWPADIFLGDPPQADPATFGRNLSEDAMDIFVLDSGSGQTPGGTGQSFDWAEAASAVVKLSSHKRVVIAGGLNPSNVSDAIEILKPWGVDVVSGVEASPGRKDPERVRAFVRAVRETGKKTS